MLLLYRSLLQMAMQEFKDVVARADFVGGSRSSPNKLRLVLHDGSFLDIWLSVDGDYAYHWERRRISGRIYRWDNAPHYPHIATYPQHFHAGDETAVLESTLSDDPELALRQVLTYIRARLRE